MTEAVLKELRGEQDDNPTHVHQSNGDDLNADSFADSFLAVRTAAEETEDEFSHSPARPTPRVAARESAYQTRSPEQQREKQQLEALTTEIQSLAVQTLREAAPGLLRALPDTDTEEPGGEARLDISVLWASPLVNRPVQDRAVTPFTQGLDADEFKRLEGALKRVGRRLTICGDVLTPERLFERLLQRPRVLHLTTHGAFARGGEFVLVRSLLGCFEVTI